MTMEEYRQRLIADIEARGGVVMTPERWAAHHEARRVAREAANAPVKPRGLDEIHAAQAARLGLTVEQVRAMHPADLDDALAGRPRWAPRWTGD